MRTSESVGTLSLTAEVFSIPIAPDRYLIYAPLRRAAFMGNARAVNVLADLREGLAIADTDHSAHALIALLRRLSIVDGEPERRPITVFNGTPAPTAVTLFLTTACNLRCTYCYAAAGDAPARFMSLEVAKRGIDYVSGNAVRTGAPAFEIAYHGGGEPSVNWRTLTESFAYATARARELGLAVSAAAATNGMLNDTQIDWVIANLSGVSLSFDGLPEVHDRHRPTVAGKGSSGRIMHTMHRFDQAGFPYGVRLTVTADQIASLPDSVEFVCANFHPETIQVEPAYQLGRWSDAPSAETEEFIAAYREAQRRAMRYEREIHYSAARMELLTNHFCGITQDSFCLTPDGNVSACYEAFTEDATWAPMFFYGKPDLSSAGYVFDHHRLGHLREQAVERRPYCDGCFAKWHCAGDCYHKSLAVNGTIEFAGSERCRITRELTKDQILARIAAQGGQVWHDPQGTDDGEAS